MTKYFILMLFIVSLEKLYSNWKFMRCPVRILNIEITYNINVFFPILASTKIRSLTFEYVLECYPVISIEKFFRKECTIGWHQSNLAC